MQTYLQLTLKWHTIKMCVCKEAERENLQTYTKIKGIIQAKDLYPDSTNSSILPYMFITSLMLSVLLNYFTEIPSHFIM